MICTIVDKSITVKMLFTYINHSQVLLKKRIKHSKPDATLLEFIASICLDDGWSVDQSSIVEVLIRKSFNCSWTFPLFICFIKKRKSKFVFQSEQLAAWTK